MVKATDYLYTPNDIATGIKGFMYRLQWRDIIGVGVLIIFALVARLGFHWRLETIFFSLFGLTILYWWIDGRVALSIGLFCLVAIPLLLFFFKRNLFAEYWSERIAVWAYYFLSLGVIKLLLDQVREKKASNGIRLSPRFGFDYYESILLPKAKKPKKYLDLHKKEW